VIHPFAVAGPDQEGLLVSGRAIRAETYLHLKDTKRRQKGHGPAGAQARSGRVAAVAETPGPPAQARSPA
jgi:hypothetical protein